MAKARMSKHIEWAQRIAALAKTGTHYAEDHYNLDRYQQLLNIAAEMLAAASDSEPVAVKFILERDAGYITPKIDVRGAVFRQGKILLVREAVDGLWSLPGGWADVGDAPSEAVEREIREESGYEARAIKLLALEDRRRRHPPLPFAVYKAAFLCELIGGEARNSNETIAVGWYAEDDLPPLSKGRVTQGQIRRWFAHLRQPDLPTEFD